MMPLDGLNEAERRWALLHLRYLKGMGSAPPKMGLERGRRLELKRLVREFTVAFRGPATITSIDLGRKRKP